jgi:two-component system OmpR family response regulator
LKSWGGQIRIGSTNATGVVVVRILVVEDSVKMATLLAQGLRQDGYAVDVVSSGRDAIWMATEHEYDAIVLDVILETCDPELDGFEVCRRLRRANCWTPVLMVTARDAVEDRVHGLDAGADDYLAKPFSLDELLARLRALLRRGARERPVVLRIGDLTPGSGAARRMPSRIQDPPHADRVRAPRVPDALPARCCDEKGAHRTRLGLRL